MGQQLKAILISGGIDSTCLAYWKRPDIGITIDYGQKPARAEIRASETLCRKLGIKHYIICLDASFLGSGDLSGKPALAVAPESDWWPYRNQFLITVAAMKAITLGVNELMVGSVKSDTYHVDGGAEFNKAISDLLSMQEGQMRVSAPANELTPVELISKSKIPRNLLGWSHSCHKSNIPCGRCRGCNKHFETLYEIDNTNG